MTDSALPGGTVPGGRPGEKVRPPLSVACVSDGDAARGSGHRYRSEASSDRSRIFDFGRSTAEARPRAAATLRKACFFVEVSVRSFASGPRPTVPSTPLHCCSPGAITRFRVCRSVTGTDIVLIPAQASPRSKMRLVDIGATIARRLRARPQQKVRAQPHSSRHTRLRPTQRGNLRPKRSSHALLLPCAGWCTIAAASALLQLATVAASARLGPRASPPASPAVSAAVRRSGPPFFAAETA